MFEKFVVSPLRVRVLPPYDTHLNDPKLHDTEAWVAMWIVRRGGGRSLPAPNQTLTTHLLAAEEDDTSATYRALVRPDAPRPPFQLVDNTFIYACLAAGAVVESGDFAYPRQRIVAPVPPTAEQLQALGTPIPRSGFLAGRNVVLSTQTPLSAAALAVIDFCLHESGATRLHHRATLPERLAVLDNDPDCVFVTDVRQGQDYQRAVLLCRFIGSVPWLLDVVTQGKFIYPLCIPTLFPVHPKIPHQNSNICSPGTRIYIHGGRRIQRAWAAALILDLGAKPQKTFDELVTAVVNLDSGPYQEAARTGKPVVGISWLHAMCMMRVWLEPDITFFWAARILDLGDYIRREVMEEGVDDPASIPVQDNEGAHRRTRSPGQSSPRAALFSDAGEDDDEWARVSVSSGGDDGAHSGDDDVGLPGPVLEGLLQALATLQPFPTEIQHQDMGSLFDSLKADVETQRLGASAERFNGNALPQDGGLDSLAAEVASFEADAGAADASLAVTEAADRAIEEQTQWLEAETTRLNGQAAAISQLAWMLRELTP
ncbi:hypothetical protein C8F01DRAFT_1243760 [Mycena amicta]|nr:hypothetical protein C8F01DRAFT_1243760 [Mycena amicta]